MTILFSIHREASCELSLRDFLADTLGAPTGVSNLRVGSKVTSPVEIASLAKKLVRTCVPLRE